MIAWPWKDEPQILKGVCSRDSPKWGRLQFGAYFTDRDCKPQQVPQWIMCAFWGQREGGAGRKQPDKWRRGNIESSIAVLWATSAGKTHKSLVCKEQSRATYCNYFWREQLNPWPSTKSLSLWSCTSKGLPQGTREEGYSTLNLILC